MTDNFKEKIKEIADAVNTHSRTLRETALRDPSAAMIGAGLSLSLFIQLEILEHLHEIMIDLRHDTYNRQRKEP